jgi:hypothetical protein
MRVAMSAGSNSDYDNYFPIICVIFGIFNDSLWTGTWDDGTVVSYYDNLITSLYIPHWL